MERILIKKQMCSIFALFIAIVLTGFGVVLFLHANLGSDTITVFIDGLRASFPISLGSASRIYNIAALLLAFVCSRKDLGWTSIVYALSTGFALDFFDGILMDFQIAQSALWMRLLLMVIGQGCIIISFALLIRFGSGMDQLDAIAYGITRRWKWNYAFIRTLLDVFLLLTGFIMGGVIGIGSIFAMASTGIGIDVMIKYVFPLFQKKKLHNIVQ